MTFTALSLSKHLIRAGAVLAVAFSASACSSAPDWVDPTTWIGGDNDQASTAPDDQQTADNGQTPDLSTVPDKPDAPSTADEQKQVSDTLAEDRSQAQYSSDALRGGTEAAAAPPPMAAPPPTDELASNDDAGEAAAKPAASPQPAPMPAAGPGTLPAENAVAENAPPPSSTPVQPAPATEVASAALPPAGEPAVPAMEPQVPANATPEFQPSSAPPLDATVAQFVAPSILARYRQTAMIGPQPAVSGRQTSEDEVYAQNRSAHGRKSHRVAMGGPESMSGAVVANFDALQGGTVDASAVSAGMTGAPAAVVYFPHDTTVLNGTAREQIRAAAKAFLAQGGQGYVRVIGHSSSGTAKMSSSRRLVWNFERSQARANAVARVLIKEGVPAEKVLVQAASDEATASTSEGGDAGRRADIFFQI